MSNPYEPPSDVDGADDPLNASPDADQDSPQDKRSGRLLLGYLAFIALYVILVDVFFS